MSDVEKAISGLVEDEELLHQQQHQQQHQQHQHHHQHQQQKQSTPLHKTNINNYNLQNETGNSLLQKQPQQLQQQQPHTHLHHHPDSNYLTVEQNNCLSRIVKLIFSTPGLVVMVVVYTIMGAFIFPLLEAPQDISKSAIIAKSREDCLKELWIITEKLNVLYERNWTMLVHEQLRRFEGTIVAATRNMAASATTTSSSSSATSSASSSSGANSGYGMATETTTTALGRFGGNNFVEYSDLTATRWSFSEALLYSVTVITTIGHGSLTPRTAGGKIATILYALIGVPLMLMCLSSLGALLAEALQCTYARLCCRWPQYSENSEMMMDGDVEKPQSNKRPQRRLSRAAGGKVDKEIHHKIKQRLQQQCDFQDHHQQGINCKNCKYDAIIGTAAGTTTTNHSYDEDDYQMCNDGLNTNNTNTTTNTTAASTTIKHGHKEDCCQLLQNSPGKFTQHLSSCMQLKMSPTMAAATAAGSHNTTATATAASTQQQYYQQRPDVMLMTTGHKLSSSQQQQGTTMATACRMVIPTQRFYQNTTPAMATYHIVSSASANSSPTHHHHQQQGIRHYLMPQQTGQTMMGGTTQHFMAVPTNMVRFQTTTPPPTHASTHSPQMQHLYGNTSSNININPLAIPVSGGSATVYFPIVTPAASSQQQQQHQQPSTTLTATAISNPAASTHPLVKYHTIQMPYKHRQQSLSLFNQPDLQDNQHHQQHHITLDNMAVNVDVDADADDDVSYPPPPPPPAYQTATVHGIRRAKFLTKPPLTHEINTFEHESDISCRHDLSQTTLTNNNLGGGGRGGEEEQHPRQQQTYVYSPTTQAAAATHCVMLSTEANTTTMTNINNFCASLTNPAIPSTTHSPSSSPSPASAATLTNNTNSNQTIYERRESTSSPLTRVVNTTNTMTTQTQGSGAATTIAATAAGVQLPTTSTTATVDIMEDEEEQEQQRLGNCPHGTPSRVPLLTHSSPQTNQDKPRSFLNATAASFHRHTLNHFHRSHNSTMANQRKSIIINRKGECNLHIPKRRNSSTTSICYGDHYETSDDELEGTNMYKLKHIQRPAQTHQHQNHLKSQDQDDYDNHSLVSLSDSLSQIPQVPIIVVLLILTFYVCLGTVIFALWENWSLIDGAYFCFVTLTTIGYGDFVPLKTFQGPEIQLFACCAYLLLGLVLVAMSFSILETQLIWKCKRLAVRLKLAKE